MCSVVGYIGDKLSRSYVLEGLTRLEYRGYDSAGFACLDSQSQHLLCVKAVGGIDFLIKKINELPIDGCVGIGHTRWATHGVPTENNAHPQYNVDKTIALVHNGIIENHSELKKNLRDRGHIFSSDTDTEVIAYLFQEALESNLLVHRAVVAVVNCLHGAYACAVLLRNHPDCLVAIRKGSPLCIGFGDGQMFVASDHVACMGHAKKILFMPDCSFALVKKDGILLYDFSGTQLDYAVQEIDDSWDNSSDKKQHEHFMLKEIYEQKRVIEQTVSEYQTINNNFLENARAFFFVSKSFDFFNVKKIVFFACGTSFYAGQIGAIFFEIFCLVETNAFLASEMRHRNFMHASGIMYCALSQSGETADTLEAMRMIDGLNMPTFVVANVPASSMVREANGYLMTQAEREVAVASTKSFTAQVATLFWFAHYCAMQKKLINEIDFRVAHNHLLHAAHVLELSMDRYVVDIKHIYAPYYARFDKFIFLGRHISYPLACEAALKFKEVAYCFVDCYPAGELKHGPIALVDATVPVFIFSVLNLSVYKKIVSAVQEIKARSGHVVVFAFEGQTELIELADTVFIIPVVHELLVPLAMIGVIQLLAYHIALILGRPIDKPRNLAKSVTVE